MRGGRGALAGLPAPHPPLSSRRQDYGVTGDVGEVGQVVVVLKEVKIGNHQQQHQC